MIILCPYCNNPTSLVSAGVIYPHRPDLAASVFYNCAPCKAYVGCHKGTNKPLGRLANRELRTAKLKAHLAFDPIWKDNQLTRKEAYKWLATQLNITNEQCHIGMFDVEQCNQVLEACKKRI